MSRKSGNGKRTKPSEKSNLWYITCLVEPGMFKGEWLVHVTAASLEDPDKPVSIKLFADERDVKFAGKPVRGNPAKGRLRVAVAKRTGRFVEVVFPQPAQPVGESRLP